MILAILIDIQNSGFNFVLIDKSGLVTIGGPNRQLAVQVTESTGLRMDVIFLGACVKGCGKWPAVQNLLDVAAHRSHLDRWVGRLPWLWLNGWAAMGMARVWIGGVWEIQLLAGRWNRWVQGLTALQLVGSTIWSGQVWNVCRSQTLDRALCWGRSFKPFRCISYPPFFMSFL